MLSAEVDTVAVEAGIVDAPGFRVVHERTNTVLTHTSARTCARVPPTHETQQETAHTLHVVEMLAAQGAAVLPPAYPTPLHLPSGRNVTFWPLASPMTNAGVTNQEMADAILSLHRTEPDPSMREWRYSEALIRRHLAKARQAEIPDVLITRLEDLLERTLFAVQIKDIDRHIAVHANAFPEKMVRHEGVVKLIDCDQTGFGPPEQDLATVVHNCRRYPTSTTEYGFLTCYNRKYDEELLQRLVKLRDVAAIIRLASMHGTRVRALAEVQHRLETLNTSHRWHLT
ncbi:MAG: phosphotransferase [Acidimicrobiaceae bacterium]|nr:phosphotransferase [Acidimicrobiaceae bacterium]